MKAADVMPVAMWTYVHVSSPLSAKLSWAGAPKAACTSAFVERPGTIDAIVCGSAITFDPIASMLQPASTKARNATQVGLTNIGLLLRLTLLARIIHVNDVSAAVPRRQSRFNTFAAPQVRMQTDRKQRGITTGPYRIVQHPMYAGALLMFAGTPLLLGSWWACYSFPSGQSSLASGLSERSICCSASWEAMETMLGRSDSG
jgi:hypothetical protein